MKRNWKVIATCVLSTVCWAGDPTKTSADFVPENASFYTNMVNGKRAYEGFVNSKGIKRLLASSMFKEAMSKMHEEDEFKEFLGKMEEEPFKSIKDVAIDGVGNEWFMAGDQAMVPFAAALVALNSEINTINVRARGDEEALGKAFAHLALKHGDLQVPNLAIGFKLSDPSKGAALLQKLPELAKKCPFPIKSELKKANNQEHFTVELSLSAQQVPEEKVLEGLKEKLDEETAKKILELLKNKKVILGVGMMKDYLIVSFGPSDPWSTTWSEKGLGSSSKLDVVRKHIDKDLFSLGYVSKEMAALQTTQVKSSFDSFTVMLDALKDQIPAELANRLNGDIEEFKNLVASSMPEPSEMVAASKFNRGVESFTYTKSRGKNEDDSKPLNVLRIASEDAFAAIATGTKINPEDIAMLKKYSAKLYGYWNDFGRAQVPEEHRERVTKLEKPVLEFMSKLGDIWINKVIPATGESSQGAFVIDTKTTFSGIPGLFPIKKPMPMLEFGTVSTLKDGTAYEAAMSELLVAVDKLIADARGADDMFAMIPEGFTVPRPTSTPFGDGNMYFYPVAGVLDANTLPHAVVLPDAVMTSTSPAQTKRAIKAKEIALKSDVVKLNEPASFISVIKPAALLPMARAWFDFAKDNPNFGDNMGEDEKAKLIEGVEIMFDIISSAKQIVSRTHAEGEWKRTHSWFNWED